MVLKRKTYEDEEEGMARKSRARRISLTSSRPSKSIFNSKASVESRATK
jgi:hypothetical protein